MQMQELDWIPTILPGTGRTSQESLRGRIATELDEIRAQMARSGAVRIRGYDVPELEDCEALAEVIVPFRHTLMGGDSPRSVAKGRIFTANESDSSKGVYLHGERSYSNYRPSVLAFFCRKAPETGGHCLFADGREIWARLSKQSASTLAKQAILYRRNLPEEPTPSRRSWKETFATSSSAEVERHASEIGAKCTWLSNGSLLFEESVLALRQHRVSGEQALMCPAPYWHTRRLSEAVRSDILKTRGPSGFHTACTFDDGSPLSNELLDEILEATTKSMKSFEWQTGDILIVDNEIALHGRTPFTGYRELLVSLGYD